MQAYKRQFIEFAFNKKILKFGRFILKSGRKSTYFFNTGLFNTGHDLAILGQFYAATLINSGITFDLLFGPAYKGIPIIITTAITLAEHYKRNVSYSFNRKEEKNYSEGGNLVGGKLQGRVILIDDVITAGTAIRESIKIIENNGATLVGVLIALDREEYGQNNNILASKEIEQKYNCKVISIITLKDLIFYLKTKPEMYDALINIQKNQ